MISNPLVKLEFIRRFRSASAAWAIPLVIGLPGLAVAVSYAAIISPSPQFDAVGNQVNSTAFTVSDLRGVGAGMFIAVLSALMAAMLLLVPALVGGTVAGERQNQTLQPLQLTDMTPAQIVAGKLVSSLAFLFLLLTCTAPVLAIPFLLGGTTALQIGGSAVVLLVIAVELAALSLAASAMMARPTTGIVVSLLVCAGLVIGPWVVMGFAFASAAQTNVAFDAGESSLRYIASLSPVSLGSWVVDSGDDEFVNVATTGDRIASSLWFIVVTAASLWFAKVKVTAPVERDR